MKRAPLLFVPALCALALVTGSAASAAPVVADPLVKFAGSAPTAIVPGANGAFFVLNSGPDSVIQYDAAGQPVGVSAALLPSGSASTAMLSDAYGSLYVANPGSHSISKVDTKTNVVKPITLPAADKPIALGISSTRDVYALESNDSITRVDSADKVTLDFAKLPVGSGALDIVTDSGGYSYTANSATDSISQISPTGVVVEYAKLPAKSAPTALIRDRLGRFVVANRLGDTLVAFDTSKPAGTAPDATYPLPAGTRPSDLVVDEFNTLFAAGSATGTISMVAAGSPSAQPVTSNFTASPTALAIGSNNRLLVASTAGGSVSSIDLETKIGTSTIGPLTVGSAFTGAATATGVGDITFSSPDLPAWLTLDPATGALSGTPTTPGPFSFTLRAQSSIGRGDARTVSFDVAEAPFTPTPTATPGTTTTGGSGAGGQGSGAGTGSGGHGTSALASTGAGDATPWGVAGAAALFLGVAASALTGRRRAQRRA